MEKIAIYGGAFDPPQKAHEYIVKKIIDDGIREEIIITPSGPRDDKVYKVKDEFREKIMNIFISCFSGYKVSLEDAFMNGSMGETTSKKMDDFFINKLGYSPIQIYGVDAARNMSNRDETGYIPFSLPKIIVTREGYNLDGINLGNYIEYNPEFPSNISSLSSTQIRKNIKNGDYSGLNIEVMKYIKENSLYIENI
ncbi:MAG: hypothetical protein PHR68_02325 [Candidatus Gracilibacteria bacterium]|nr:hypothetical protein [Candidatus Gracilibacteria bacterium]